MLLNVLATLPLISGLLADTECQELAFVSTRNGKCGTVPEKILKVLSVL